MRTITKRLSVEQIEKHIKASFPSWVMNEIRNIPRLRESPYSVNKAKLLPSQFAPMDQQVTSPS